MEKLPTNDGFHLDWVKALSLRAARVRIGLASIEGLAPEFLFCEQLPQQAPRELCRSPGAALLQGHQSWFLHQHAKSNVNLTKKNIQQFCQ